MIRQAALVCLVAAAAYAMAGCAVPVAVAASAGLAAAQAGSSAWVNGELRDAALADLETIYQAVLLALEDLDVNVLTERKSERSAFIMAKEPGGPEIRITMLRRTPCVTRIGVRVGMLGELSTSQVVMLRIQAHLPDDAIGLDE